MDETYFQDLQKSCKVWIKEKKFWNLYKSSDTLYNIWKKELICLFSLNIFQKLEYEKFLPRTS